MYVKSVCASEKDRDRKTEKVSCLQVPDCIQNSSNSVFMGPSSDLLSSFFFSFFFKFKAEHLEKSGSDQLLWILSYPVLFLAHDNLATYFIAPLKLIFVNSPKCQILTNTFCPYST